MEKTPSQIHRNGEALSHSDSWLNSWQARREAQRLDEEYERLNVRDEKPSVFKMQDTFYRDHESMSRSNQDIPFLFLRLKMELDELLGPPDEGVDAKDHIENECCDIVLFAQQIIRAIGRDPEDALRFKLAWNTAKFVPALFDPAIPYEQGYGTSRKIWAETKGKEDFYVQS